MRGLVWAPVKCWLLVLVVGVLLGGCALFQKPADTLSLDRGKTYAVFYRLGKLEAKLVALVEARCKAKVLDREFCDAAAQAHVEWERSVERPLLRSFATPGYVTDWEAVGEAVEIIAGLAGAAAGVPGLGAVGGAVGKLGGALGK